MADPWTKFYWSDWRSDPALRMCCLAARGLWLEMLAIMHEAEPRGSLLVKGRPVTNSQLAVLVGAPAELVDQLITELEEAGVLSRKKNGTIFSRRQEKEENLSRKNRDNGKKGGNPLLVASAGKATGKQTELNRDDNPPDKPGLKAQKPEARS